MTKSRHKMTDRLINRLPSLELISTPTTIITFIIVILKTLSWNIKHVHV